MADTLEDLYSEVFGRSPAVRYATTARPQRPMPRQMRAPELRGADPRLAPSERTRAYREVQQRATLPALAMRGEAQRNEVNAPPPETALELTGLPAVRRGTRELTRSIVTDRPQDAWPALGELALGAGTALTLPMMTAGRPRTPARASPRMTEPPPQLPPRAPDAGPGNGGRYSAASMLGREPTPEEAQLWEEGFDLRNEYFHGTSGPFEGEALRPSVHGRLGPGVYITPHQRMARVSMGRSETGEMVSLHVKGSPWRGQFVTPEEFFAEVSRQSRRLVGGERTADEGYARAVAALSRRGKIGVWGGNEATVWNPANIRMRRPHRPSPDAPSTPAPSVSQADAVNGGNFDQGRVVYRGSDIADPLDIRISNKRDAERAVFFSESPSEAENFGRHVHRYNINADLKDVRWADYDPDPIYDPDVMARILDDARREGASGVRIRGVQNFEHGPQTTTIALFDKRHAVPFESGARIARASIAGPDGGAAGRGQFVDVYTGMRGATDRPWRGHEWVTRDEGVAREYGPNVRRRQADISGAPTVRTEADLRRLLGDRADELLAQRRGDVWEHLDDAAVRDALRERGVGVVRVPDDMVPNQPDAATGAAGDRWHESYLFLDDGRLRTPPARGDLRPPDAPKSQRRPKPPSGGFLLPQRRR